MHERLDLPAPRPPAGFTDRVMARLARRRRARFAMAGAVVLAAAGVVAALYLRQTPDRGVQVAAGARRELGPALTLEGPARARPVAGGWRLEEGTIVLHGGAAAVDTELCRVRTTTPDGRVTVVVGQTRDTMKRVVQGTAGAAVVGAVVTIFVLRGEAHVDLAPGQQLALKTGDRALVAHGSPPVVVPGHHGPEGSPPVAMAHEALGTEQAANLDAAAQVWLESRQGHVYRCWHEAKARGGAIPEGKFTLMVHAEAKDGRARVTGTIVAGDKATRGDDRFGDCVSLALANPDLPVPPGAGTGKGEYMMALGDAIDMVDDVWRTAHGLENPERVVPDDVEDVPPGFIDPGDSPAIGPKDAPVTIIEFSDFQCPFCAAGAMTMHKVVLAYGDKVRFVFKNKPLPSHDKAALAAQAAAAAHEQGKFWEMHDLIFANQDKLDRKTFDEYARVIGLDQERFRRALDEGKFADIIAKDAAVADDLGVKGVPSFVINGRFVQGSRPYESFAAIIDEELAKAKSPAP